MAVRGPRRAEGGRALDRGSRLASGARLGHARIDSIGSHRSGKGAPPGVSVVVVGLNHRTTPLPVLEAMTVPPARMAKALHDLVGRDHLSEVVIVSTCL